jgi:hypothetical protein
MDPARRHMPTVGPECVSVLTLSVLDGVPVLMSCDRHSSASPLPIARASSSNSSINFCAWCLMAGLVMPINCLRNFCASARSSAALVTVFPLFGGGRGTVVIR